MEQFTPVGGIEFQLDKNETWWPDGWFQNNMYVTFSLVFASQQLTIAGIYVILLLSWHSYSCVCTTFVLLSFIQCSLFVLLFFFVEAYPKTVCLILVFFVFVCCLVAVFHYFFVNNTKSVLVLFWFLNLILIERRWGWGQGSRNIKSQHEIQISHVVSTFA